MGIYRRQWLMTLAAGAGAVALGTASQARGLPWGKIEPAHQSLLIASAYAMVNLCTALMDEFKKNNPKTISVIERGDSIEGLLAVKRGAIDLAAITQEIDYEEDRERLKNYLIARSYISIIVNRSLSVSELTQEQVSAIFRGDIANWKEVGGIDLPIQVVSRARGSSTRQYVEDIVLNGRDFFGNAQEVETTRAMADTVASMPGAIGYIAAKDDAGEAVVKKLLIDKVEPSELTVLSSRYPYTHSFYLLVVEQESLLKTDFVKFALSAQGQSIVAAQGLIPVA